MLKISLSVSALVFIFALACYVTADDQDVSASLLYCDEEVRNFSLASGVDSLLMSGIEQPTGVDYHLKSKVFFWVDENHLYKAPLWQEGARPYVLRRDVHSLGLAVDWIHDLIYWTTWGQGAIQVSRLDGSMVRTVLKRKDISPNCIAINPAEGFMFWAHFHDEIGKIERCNMDGTSRKVIIKEDISYVQSLTIDLGSQRIFWVDFNKGYVSSAEFDGHHRINLIIEVPNPRSIDIYGQYVYFIAHRGDIRFMSVYKASKENGSGLTYVFRGKETLNSLKILDPSKQLKGYNVCGDNNGGCSHLCLPTSGRAFSCACPDDYEMSSDNFTCLNIYGSTGTYPTFSTNVPSSQLPFTVSQTNFTSSTEANKNIHETVGFFNTLGILALVIASLTLIAMVGMMIYVRQIFLKTVANLSVANPVQNKRCEENIYLEAPL